MRMPIRMTVQVSPQFSPIVDNCVDSVERRASVQEPMCTEE